MLRNRKGITLIALVITIIVMLILAGVTISTLTGQGSIIESSKNVVGKYNNKVIEEQETLNEIIEYIKNDGQEEEARISISVVPDTTGVTKKVIVTIVGYAEEGIKKFTSTIGDNKTYEEGTKEIVETCEITENGVYTFTIEDNKGNTAHKGILIENIIEGTIQISPDKTSPTNKDIKVTVTWPSGSDTGVKEISKNGGTTWQTVTGETSTFEVSENCTIKARVRNNGENAITASLTITNIDKLAPNTFTPEVSVTSNSITISGRTTDKEATSTNGSSGIAGYYYSKDGGSSWQTNTNPLTESYTYTGLSQGTSYPLKMKAVDKAGNETVIDIGNKTTTNIAGLGTITIKPSTTTPTNQDIKVSVTWPSNTEGLTKQISINNGSTWSTYTGEVTISSNCTVKARLIDSINQTGTAASLTITNIDKLAPNTFVPEVSVTSNSITISGRTTDKEATSTNGSSGIAGYYYSKDGGSSWQTNTNPLTESYTYTGLSQGTSYPLKMKAVDKAGNETVIDIGNKTTTNIAGLGTITIKPSTTTPTNQDIKVSVTWPSNTEGLTKQISINNGSTWSTYTGEVTISSNCTVKARLIDSINQTGTTASLTITNIDKTNPTVTATSGTETITVGDSNEISKYFTWQANGTYGITSVVYTDTSNNNAVVTNTNTLAEGSHVIKCTVTKETGATASATKLIIVEDRIVNATEIANNPSEYYGGYVTNYTTPSGDPDVWWRIFYADESNIYLIASDYIHYDYAPTSANYTLYKNSTDYMLAFDNVYQDYTGSVDITDARIRKWIQKYLAVAPSSTNTNIRAVAFMLDEQAWSAKYANSNYAEYAIGGPTLEMFVASYNETHPEKPMYCSADSTGYYISWTNGGTDYSISGLDRSESLYVISDVSKAYSMWLGSPSANYASYVMYAYFYGEVNYENYYAATPGFRPVVCLNSDIQLEKQSNGTYLIK